MLFWVISKGVTQKWPKNIRHTSNRKHGGIDAIMRSFGIAVDKQLVNQIQQLNILGFVHFLVDFLDVCFFHVLLTSLSKQFAG